MYVELKKKCEVVTTKKLVVILDFNNIGEATDFIRPFVSATKGPAVIDLTDKSEVTIRHEAFETFD